LSHPSLTAIRTHRFEAGSRVAELVLTQISGSSRKAISGTMSFTIIRAKGHATGCRREFAASQHDDRPCGLFRDVSGAEVHEDLSGSQKVGGAAVASRSNLARKLPVLREQRSLTVSDSLSIDSV
jgi:hypothetical protein